MVQNEKDLLLKDLCYRLPYGVKAQVYNHWRDDIQDETITIENLHQLIETFSIKDIKPYLFPLSSMTEDQKNEYYSIVNYISSDDTENWKEGEFIYVDQFSSLIHFYHINHLDYLGLIPKGLAIDATGLNIYK